MLALAALVFSVASSAAVTQDYPETIVLFSHVSFDGKTHTPGKCTGTFIHPRLLLTAAHCVRHFNSLKINGVVTRFEDMQGRPLPDVTAKPTEVYVLQKKWWGMKKLHPVRVHVSPSSVPVNRANLSLKHVEEDLAILEFATDLGAGRVRELTPRTASAGDSVVMVGFGGHGPNTGGAGFGNVMPKKHFGRNTVKMVELDMIVVEGSTETCARPERHTDDWALCGGDSGGPLIDAETGRILGVASATAEIRYPWMETRRKLSFFADVTSTEGARFIRDVLRSVEGE